jgi:hypothetical protein
VLKYSRKSGWTSSWASESFWINLSIASIQEVAKWQFFNKENHNQHL